MCDTPNVDPVELRITLTDSATCSSDLPDMTGSLRLNLDGSGGLVINMRGKAYFLAFDWRSYE